MKIGLRAGHSPQCPGACSNGRIEHYQMKSLFKACKRIFESSGIEVIDCNSLGTESQELKEGCRTANRENVDIFISLHMNAFNKMAHGTECWVYPSSSVIDVANRICKNFENLGFTNRGVKSNKNFYEMKNIKAPNIIVETCFIDSEKDMEIWSPIPWEVLGRNICNAVAPNLIPLEKEEEKEDRKIEINLGGKDYEIIIKEK